MMDRPCEFESLESLARGELSAEAAAAVASHAAGCDNCREELRALRAERALFVARAAAAEPLPPALLRSVEERVAAESARARPRHRRQLWLGAAAAAAIAASVIWSQRALLVPTETTVATGH